MANTIPLTIGFELVQYLDVSPLVIMKYRQYATKILILNKLDSISLPCYSLN